MKARIIASGLIAALTVGCMSNPADRQLATVDQSTDLSGYFQQRLEAGRHYLKQDLPTKAIDAFRQASRDPRIAAEAMNGMGVAYTRLGRQDVARTLFLRAVEHDPTDPRFARNLARLDVQPVAPFGAPHEMIAARDTTGDSSANPGQITGRAPEQSGAVTASNGFTPNKRREVFITTASAARPLDTAIRVGGLDARPGPTHAGAVVTVLKTDQAYPLRFAYSRIGPRQEVSISGARGPGYPIRVALDSLKPANGLQR